MNNAYGVRPAFNFSPSSLIYATAASVASNGAAFESVSSLNSASDKPAYKVYLKTADYVNYNTNTSSAPKISTSGGKVTVTKSGQSGSAVILLADKSGNGEVKYQATASFEGGVASATLPSDVNVNNYVVTVLFTDGTARGGEYAESITGSFTYSGLATPEDVSVVYNGSLRSISDLSNEDWFDSSVYNDPSRMKVTFPSAKDKGEYTVSFNILDPDIEWGDGSTGSKSITLKVTSKPIEITWTDDDDGVPIPSAKDGDLCTGDTIKFNVMYTGTVTSNNEHYESTQKPKKAGSYTVAVTSLDNANYGFATTAIKSKSFTLDIRSLSEPTLLSTVWLTYNGNNRTYTINSTSYDSDDIEITVPTEFTGDVNFNSLTNIISVTNAGDYYLNLRIKDKDNCWWKDTHTTEDRKLEFKVLTYEIELELNSGSSSMSGTFGEDIDLDIEVVKEILAGKTLVIDVSAEYNSVPFDLLDGGLQLDEDSSVITKTLKASSLPAMGEYALKLTLRKDAGDNRNFAITYNSVTLKLEEEGSGRDVWRITKSTGGYYGSRFYANMGTTSVTYPNAIPFDGKNTYGIEFIPATTGLQVDNYNSDGYINGYKTAGKNSANSALGKNADEYTTTVRVIDTLNGNAVVEYTITWTVEPYKFDLSSVKWANGGKLEYTGAEQSPSLTGLPSELALKNLIGANVSGTNAMSYGSVSATFKIADGFDPINYILPTQGDSDSYKGSFDWSVNWEIVPVEIKLNWDYKDYQDINNLPYKVLVLTDGRIDGKVDYQYFEWDNVNNKFVDENSPLRADQIEVDVATTKYYKARPVLQSIYAGNYVFPDGADIYSFVFGVGGGATKIELSLTNTSYTYTGKDVSLQWATGTPVGSLDFKFYIGDAFGNAIDYTPKSVGTYWVEVTSKNSAVVLDGETRFQFAITKSIIDPEWKTTAKPPVLGKLTSIQLKEGIEYEYYDADMHKVDFSQLSNGGTFKIRAVIKEESRANFEFAGGEVETQLVEFTVAAGEDLKDPSDINNPNYSFDDEENPNPPSKPQIPIEWDTSKNPPQLIIPDEWKDQLHPDYEYFDKDGNKVNPEDMVDGEDYTVNVKIPDDEKDKFEFVDKDGNKVDIDNLPPHEFEKKPDSTTSVDLGKVGEILRQYWQLIVIIISVILIIIFLSKTAGYESKRKKFKKKTAKFDNVVYAAAPLLGLPMTTWTVIACICLGLAAASLAIMIIAKVRCGKAEEEYEDGLEEFNRNKADLEKQEALKRDENMRMMFMGMMGGNNGSGGSSGQGAYFMQQGLGADEIRGIVSETMTAMLPGMQQMLPQQASTNDELVQKLLEKTEKNEETMKKLMKKISEQPSERVVEREGGISEDALERLADKLQAQSNINEKTIEKIVGKLQPVAASIATDETILKVVEQSGHNDETIKLMLKNQEVLMQKIIELSGNQGIQPQVIEKVVEKEVPVEKIVEKEVKVEVPVEKIIEKEVPVEVEKVVEKIVEVPVEKVVEKEVVKEVKVEVPIEKVIEKEIIKEVPVEKIVEKEIVKEVKVPVAMAVTSNKVKKESAPRLTLDEAYAQLSKQQQKYFDGLREYALKKEKAKEKKSTYAIVIGQSTANPLIKLTIKKDMTVALFKMEDEYLKDIKRDATSDGTKVKVKETEVMIGDAQACKTAKNMIDLREDQIERYQDLLKEQRIMKKFS